MKRWLLVLLLLAPAASAQNQIGDECIIRIELDATLLELTITYDLLFDDAAWGELTAQVDADASGDITAQEIDAWEARVVETVARKDFPANRLVNMEVPFEHGAYSGEAGAAPTQAVNATRLVNFEGPVEERAGKLVQESWTYTFQDPLVDYGATLKARAKAIIISWGPDAVEEHHGSVSVVETVQVAAPKGWWIFVDGERHKDHTFASGDGYKITFVPTRAPPDPPFWESPGLGVGALLLGVAVLAWQRRQGA